MTDRPAPRGLAVPRGDLLRSLGWRPDTDAPDEVLCDAAAEAGLGDAQTLRRGFALERARALLALLAAHDGRERCPECREELENPFGGEEGWCPRCEAFRPAPRPAELAARLAAALADAGDVRIG